MKSVTRLVMVSALVAVLGVSLGIAPAFAKTVKGTVVSMDGGMVVVRTVDGQEQHYTLGTGVAIPSDVRTGSIVEVTVGDTGDQTTVVSAIRTSGATTTTSTSTYNTSPNNTSTSTSTYNTQTSTNADQADANNQYADTASPIWMYALVGLFALAGGMAFRRSRVS